MRKECILIGIVIILITSTITGAATAQHHPATTDGTIFYVGGVGPANYTHIQDAIDVAADGDTVFVYSNRSPYQESLTITKAIQLTGETQETTVIHGTLFNDVVFIKSDNVTITGFTIQGNGKLSQRFGIWVYGNNELITGNIVENNDVGIAFTNINNPSPHGHRIQNNIIRNNNALGIEFVAPITDAIISSNFITGNRGYGIGILGTQCTITHNILTDNAHFGIAVIGDVNTVTENTIQSTQNIHGHGAAAISIFGANNTITRNNLINNKRPAIQTQFIESRAEKDKIQDKNNTWDANYWGTSLFTPYKIQGRAEIQNLPFNLGIAIPIYGWLPWISYDTHPAQQPYDISTLI
jgi:parallel beta-helix repeat protein